MAVTKTLYSFLKIKHSRKNMKSLIILTWSLDTAPTPVALHQHDLKGHQQDQDLEQVILHEHTHIRSARPTFTKHLKSRCTIS